MFLAANPEKDRSVEEKEETKKKYTPGEDVLPKLEQREKSLRQRRAEEEDRRLVDEVRLLSLREVGVADQGARREHRRREGSRSHVRSSRDNSRDNRHADERERRLRRETDPERRRARDDINLRPTTGSGEERVRRRSTEQSRRHEQISQTPTTRQVEHQSSLRSLLSTSDVDSQEMEEEILRQIREEGLLDGIDLENLDVSQEDQISERIADAFRRRQEEKKRQERARRREASRNRLIAAEGSATSAPELSGEEGSRATRQRRTHSRTTSATSQVDTQTRPPPAASASRATHLEVQAGPETRRRRRTTSGDRSSAVRDVASEPRSQPASRSQTDLSERPRLSQSAITSASRSSTEPIQRSQQANQPAREPQVRQNSETSRTRLRSEEAVGAPASSSTTRAPPPAELVVPDFSESDGLQVDRSLMPAPLSPRHSPNSSVSDRAFALSSASRPTSSSSSSSKQRLPLFPEPSLTCARCGKTHIEYDVHYNCRTCQGGNWNICLGCYRSGLGCLYWFGFGSDAAWSKWESLKQSGELDANAEPPHMLTANRYIPPKSTPGGADGRKTLTNEDPQKRLQSGVFCSNCLTWANECYWKCDSCNEGDWGFCNNCVNQGKSCTHALLPLTYKPAESYPTPLSPSHTQLAPSAATILTGPGIIDLGPFRPLTFSTRCDNCHQAIQPSSKRFHCFSCTSTVIQPTQPGDYDICMTCYPKLVTSRRISSENGPNGWRRCLHGHRMVVVGFQDSQAGQRRIVFQDLVGGRGLQMKPCVSPELSAAGIQEWSWADGAHVRLVTSDVSKTAPTSAPGMTIDRSFPPGGGVGMKCQALWGWYRNDDADDELLFPKGAEVTEVKDVNGDWYHGSYMGQRGLFPAPYVRVLEDSLGK